MNTRLLLITLMLILLVALGYVLARWQRGDDVADVTRTQIALGTVVEIQLRGADPELADEAANAAFAEIRRLDTLFSTYLETSPVWRFNSTRDPVRPLPPEVRTLLRRCRELWAETGGCFDVSMQALVAAWGFEGGAPAVPDPEPLQRALTACGMDRLEVHNTEVLVRAPGLGLNFGAVAKGLAVDRAVEVLRKHGMGMALVNAGGEIAATGGSWQVGIQHPRDEGSLLAVVDPAGRAIATSGDYEQFFEVDGTRYHHILDPATGLPARGCRSVTVLAGDVLTADAIATAVFVMGPEKGMEFINASAEYEALIVDSTGAVHASPGFEEYTLR